VGVILAADTAARYGATGGVVDAGASTRALGVGSGIHVVEDDEGRDTLVLGSEELHEPESIFWTDDAAERWADSMNL
jgi:hypothetical protein